MANMPPNNLAALEAEIAYLKDKWAYYPPGHPTRLECEVRIRAMQYELDRDRYGVQPGQWLMPLPSVGKAPKAAPKLLPEETVVEAVQGWRKWRASLFGSVLRSTNQQTQWPALKRMEAECGRSDCNGVDCTCGLWAHKELKQVTKEYGDPNPLTDIYGQVNLWGRVLECTKGYRAQYAYPKGFCNTGSLAQHYAKVYQVPLIEDWKK